MDERGEPTRHQATPPHGADGRFVRSPETAARDAEAARLRSRGMSYRKIAAKLGYEHHSSVQEAVSRALADITREPAEELVKLELERLDTALARMHEIMETTHYTASNKGGVVEYAGEPLVDDGPVIAAAMAIVKIGESRRKLLGLDAETKVSVSGGVKYEIVGVSPEDIVGDMSGNE